MPILFTYFLFLQIQPVTKYRNLALDFARDLHPPVNWFVVYFDFNPKSHPRLQPERYVPLHSPSIRTE